MANRHPKHLKGRDIGLWYKQRSREKRDQQQDIAGDNSTSYIRKKDNNLPIISSVSLPKEIIDEINEMLNIINNDNTLEPFSVEFEKYFNSILNTSFEDYIDDEMKSYKPVMKSDIEDDEIQNQNLKLLLDFEKLEEKEEYKEVLSIRNKLPVFEKYDLIINQIIDNQVILISGDTGCGKTTQIPQFILDYYIKNRKGNECNIFCTQPRRISAISVAERVAWERKESVGISVGYQIRLQSVRPRSRGSITYCTTGVLLRRMESDPLLKNMSHIVLDEIHERDVDTDILLTLLKKICPIRKDLKVILMSATFSTETFSKYFENCPIIEVHGTLHPVHEYYLEDVLEEIKFCDFPTPKSHKTLDTNKINEFRQIIEPYARLISNKYSTSTINGIRNFASEEININLIKNLIFHIVTTKPNGAILVFLPGYDKISNLHRDIIESKFYRTKKLLVYPLHSTMPTTDQKAIFNRPPNDYWKVILSTNIAETSITIDDVVYVIDSGKIKITDYDKERNLQMLNEKWVSLANSQQRKGRAGRVQSGICYRLYTKARESIFDQFPKPEILRTKLDGIILNLKMLRIHNVENFMQTMVDIPSPEALKNSINMLKRMNALDANEKITPLGLHLARLPVDPQMGKMLLMASIFRCIDPITSIAASLSFKDAFYRPIGKEKQVDEIKRNLANNTRSDHLMLANIIQNFQRFKDWTSKKLFCNENFLSISTLNQLVKMKNQFHDILNEASFLHSSDYSKSNINSSNEKIICAVLCAGLYPNVAYLKKIRTIKNRVDAFHSMITAEDGKVEFHPSSVNSKQRYFDSRLFVYFMKQKSSSLYIFDSTMVNPLPLLLFADDISSGVSDNREHYLSISNKFKFKSDVQTTKLIMELRRKLQLFLQKKALYPSPIDEDSTDDMFLNVLVYLLTKEGKMTNNEDNESD